MVASVVPVEPFDLVVFGATGDLARRKLLPALYHRLQDGQLPSEARIIATARSDLDTDAYRKLAAEALKEFVGSQALQKQSLDRLLSIIDYVRMDASKEEGWSRLAEALPIGSRRPRVYYLSVAPRFFGEIARGLRDAGLAGGDARIVVEKPLGHDLDSARDLNRNLVACFDEQHVYRIDHYLGKETVQNLMALRFGNALLEPLWNAQHIDHVQITVAESVGIGGRGRYYDDVGAMRDMVQNHLLQLMCLIAMEPPARFEPDAVRDEKLKVLRSLAPLSDPEAIVRGQYARTNGSASYLDDVECDASNTETFVALKAEVANWRWSGVPFYLRTGKRLRARVSEIAISFRAPPYSIFAPASGRPVPNVLVIRLQPDEGITLQMTIKDPGPGGMRLAPAILDMSFADTMGSSLRMPDAYERLVMDVIRGDQTLFMRGDEVEAAWAWIDPMIAEFGSQPPALYDAGSSGPEDAMLLIHRDRRRWQEIAT
ncbi:MAG: glucose-6-phosphate dehydrogenase [Pseudomonadota bacterium]